MILILKNSRYLGDNIFTEEVIDVYSVVSDDTAHTMEMHYNKYIRELVRKHPNYHKRKEVMLTYEVRADKNTLTFKKWLEKYYIVKKEKFDEIVCE